MSVNDPRIGIEELVAVPGTGNCFGPPRWIVVLLVAYNPTYKYPRASKYKWV